MRKIGLHLRFNGSLQELAHKAQELRLPFFQFFLVLKGSGMPIMTPHEDIQEFIKLTRDRFEALYVHGSYWINLAGIRNNGFRAFQRELAIAQSLGATHMIIHPGSAQGAENKQVGIEALSRALNRIFKLNNDVKIVLENIAHGGLSVGGDIDDFSMVRDRLDHPEKLLLCIDTAHAYSYGYDIADTQEREKFIQMLVTQIGIHAIPLIHLNDTSEACGSKIDKHELLGKGRIGLDALRSFVMDKRLAGIPLLMEPPVVGIEEEMAMLALVRSWHEDCREKDLIPVD
jgi:deoxyribonuclease IV